MHTRSVWSGRGIPVISILRGSIERLPLFARDRARAGCRSRFRIRRKCAEYFLLLNSRPPLDPWRGGANPVREQVITNPSVYYRDDQIFASTGSTCLLKSAKSISFSCWISNFSKAGQPNLSIYSASFLKIGINHAKAIKPIGSI